jgi:hypothetical protein
MAALSQAKTANPGTFRAALAQGLTEEITMIDEDGLRRLLGLFRKSGQK